MILPTWEQILSQELIPKFQRALTVATPQLAQTAANEITRRHGLGSPERGVMQATIWRTSGQAVGGDGESSRRTLPVVDPEMDNQPNQASYVQAAQQQRSQLANTYLNQWNNNMMAGFDRIAKMSQFGVLWRGFTCGQLDKLLNQDYPNSNLPFQIRSANGQPMNNAYIEQDYHFVGVAYWPQVPETMPGIFQNPNPSSAETFSELYMFIPANRLIRVWTNPNPAPNPGISIGGVGENLPTLPGSGGPVNNGGANNNGPSTWSIGRQNKPTSWDLLNQSWTVKIVPAVSTSIPTILSTPPPQVASGGQQPQVPNLSNFSSQNLTTLNTH